MATSDRAIVERLARDGILTLSEAGPRTTRRWQSAMMRAIARRMSQGGDDVDVRYVVADALVELYGADLADDALVAAVEAVTHVELELLHVGAQPKTTAAEGPPGK